MSRIQSGHTDRISSEEQSGSRCEEGSKLEDPVQPGIAVPSIWKRLGVFLIPIILRPTLSAHA